MSQVDLVRARGGGSLTCPASPSQPLLATPIGLGLVIRVKVAAMRVFYILADSTVQIQLTCPVFAFAIV